jgi:perosamine synthetase
MFDDFINFVQDIYSTKEFIPLHAPNFNGNEKIFVLDTINSTYVSSVGKYVDDFENSIKAFTGVKFAVATVNGTAALHIALKLSGVENDTEVITQSFTFVATCNAIRYCGAKPILIDVDRDTLGLCPVKLKFFLEENCELRDDGFCWNKLSNSKILVCLPMHTFGFPSQLDEIENICSQYNIQLIEDAAESLGSYYKDSHTGNKGKLAITSFNGNKIITSGGGGMILTNDEELAKKAKHITTTAKLQHPWEFVHDEVGYNYRLPNINAALGLAQMESIKINIISKRGIAKSYQNWGQEHDFCFINEPKDTKANYWLNQALMRDKEQRDKMLKITNLKGVMTRPAWTPMHYLKINKDCQTESMENTEWLFDRLVSVPSSAIFNV